MLWRQDFYELRTALEFEFEGQRKKGSLRWTPTKQDEEDTVEIGLSREDVLFRSKLIGRVNQIASMLR